MKNPKKVHALHPVISPVGSCPEEFILNMKKHNWQDVYYTVKYKKLQTGKHSSLRTVADTCWCWARAVLGAWVVLLHRHRACQLPWGGGGGRQHSWDVGQPGSALVPNAAVQVTEDGSSGTALGGAVKPRGVGFLQLCAKPRAWGGRRDSVTTAIRDRAWWCSLDYFYFYFSAFF